MTITAATVNENKPDLSKTSCLYCKELGHLIKDCLERIRKEQEQKQDPPRNVKRFIPKTQSPCPLCQRTIHPPKNCLTGPNTANRSQMIRRNPPSSDRKESPKEGTSTQKTPPSI